MNRSSASAVTSESADSRDLVVAEPREGATVSRGCVLLALEEHGQPSDILRQAAALARAVGLDLHVLRVIRQRAMSKLLSHLYLGTRLALVRRSLRGSRAARVWCDETLGEPAVPVHVRMGDFLKEVSAFVTQSAAKLVIVPPREGNPGGRVTALAGACSRPVLVLRTAGEFRTLVAATDLEDDEYPVLRSAVELAARLEVRVLAVHNVSPITAVLPLEAAFATTMVLGAERVRLRSERLMRASSHLATGVQAVVCNQPDTVGAILRQSQPERSALVVVGTRTKPWLGRFIVKSVAAEVVNRSASSVLVTPVRLPPWFDGAEQRRRRGHAATT
jgi:nucleotide-binding universal stress UspA family protein